MRKILSLIASLASAMVVNTQEVSEQITPASSNVIFNLFRNVAQAQSLYNRGNVGTCGDLEEMAKKYYSGDVFMCTEGKAVWNCQIYSEGFTCSSTVQKFDTYFQYSGFLVGSTIVSNMEEKKYLYSILPAKKVASTLLYRGSRDGWQAFDFHSRCDNKGATITLFRSDKGRRIGGYTGQSWDSLNRAKADSSAFLFALDQKMKYPVQQAGSAIYCGSTIGPKFGGVSDELGAMNTPFNQAGYGQSLPGGNAFNIPKDASGNSVLTNTNGGFNIQEIEVWLVNLYN